MNYGNQKTLLEVIKRGGDLSLGAEALGITVRALQAELAQDNVLADKVDAARDYAIEKAIVTIFEAAHEGNLTAAKFIAERRRSEDWAATNDPAISFNFGAAEIDVAALHRRLEALNPAPDDE